MRESKDGIIFYVFVFHSTAKNYNLKKVTEINKGVPFNLRVVSLSCFLYYVKKGGVANHAQASRGENLLPFGNTENDVAKNNPQLSTEVKMVRE